jgi:hypothetical protein
VFKYAFLGRLERMSRKKVEIASLVRVLRDGGLRVALVARYSAIPGRRAFIARRPPLSSHC